MMQSSHKIFVAVAGIVFLVLLGALVYVSQYKPASPQGAPVDVAQVSPSPDQLNASQKEMCTIEYTQSLQAEVAACKSSPCDADLTKKLNDQLAFCGK